MRFFLFTGLCLGIVLVMGAVFLSIDQAVTDEDRAPFQAEIDAQAAEYDVASGFNRRRDLVGKTADLFVTMRDGMFKSSGLKVRNNLPAAPQGWSKAAFEVSHLEQVARAPYVKGVAMNGQESLFDRFVDASYGRRLGAAATYSNGDALVIVQITGSMSNIRDAEEGRVRRAGPVRNAIALIDNVPVQLEKQSYRDPFKDRDIPVDYQRVTMNLDGLVHIEAVTNGSKADLLAVLEGLDVVGLQSGLPVALSQYRQGSGFVSLLESESAEQTDG